jgi:hypothetical protein
LGYLDSIPVELYELVRKCFDGRSAKKEDLLSAAEGGRKLLPIAEG